MPGHGLSWRGRFLEELLQHENDVHEHFARVLRHLLDTNAVIADVAIRDELKTFRKGQKELALESATPLEKEKTSPAYCTNSSSKRRS